MKVFKSLKIVQKLKKQTFVLITTSRASRWSCQEYNLSPVSQCVLPSQQELMRLAALSLLMSASTITKRVEIQVEAKKEVQPIDTPNNKVEEVKLAALI